MHSGFLKGHQGTPRVFRSPFKPWFARFVTTCLGAPKGTRERALGGSRRGGTPAGGVADLGGPRPPRPGRGGPPLGGGSRPPLGGYPGKPRNPFFAKIICLAYPGGPKKAPLGALGPCLNIYSPGSFVQGCRGFGPAGGKVPACAKTCQNTLHLGGLEPWTSV